MECLGDSELDSTDHRLTSEQRRRKGAAYHAKKQAYFGTFFRQKLDPGSYHVESGKARRYTMDHLLSIYIFALHRSCG